MLDLAVQCEEEMIERYDAPRTIIQPTYCVEEGIWFTDNGVTAKSLAELQRKLRGCTIEGYYPNGYNTTPRVKKPKPVLSVPWTEPNPKPLPTIREGRKAAPPEFAEPIPVIQGPVEFKKVRPKRKYVRGGTPATTHDVQRINWVKDLEAIPTLRRLMREGWPTTEVARRMGTTNNAIIGACHRNGIPISEREKD